MNRKRLNNVEVYEYLKAHTIEEAMTKFGAPEKAIANIKRIGDDLFASVQESKPLSTFSPRDLMMELANRGYRGKLTFQQVIDINNF